MLSIQRIMTYDVHVGGMTALTLQGYGHYLRLGSNAPVWVYGEDMPSWMRRLPLNAPLVTRTSALFSDPALGLTKDNAKTESTLPWNWQLRMSSPERAILEVMDELPGHESFHNLDMVFESLTTLRPRTLSALLHSCRKIKVRRLFFVFADRHNHPWRKRLDPQEFNLGSGDRDLVKGGTAINLFYRDLPRLSVDIDLTYLPVKYRADSLAEINEAMDRIATATSGVGQKRW